MRVRIRKARLATATPIALCINFKCKLKTAGNGNDEVAVSKLPRACFGRGRSRWLEPHLNRTAEAFGWGECSVVTADRGAAFTERTDGDR